MNQPGKYPVDLQRALLLGYKSTGLGDESYGAALQDADASGRNVGRARGEPRASGAGGGVVTAPLRQPPLFTRRDLMVEAVASPERQASHDAFYTPPLLADFCVDVLTRPNLVPTWLGKRSSVVEPSAGGGAFVEALLKRTQDVHAIDIDPEAAGLRLARTSDVADFLTWEPEREVDWAIGNPPFGVTDINDGDAEAHIRRALSFARVGCAFLLRQGFVASKERIPFWSQHPAALRVDLLERPSFTGDGKSDMYDYAFIVWLKGHKGPGRWVTASWKKHRVPAAPFGGPHA